jgi:hypothetical protein
LEEDGDTVMGRMETWSGDWPRNRLGGAHEPAGEHRLTFLEKKQKKTLTYRDICGVHGGATRAPQNLWSLEIFRITKVQLQYTNKVLKTNNQAEWFSQNLEVHLPVIANFTKT